RVPFELASRSQVFTTDCLAPTRQPSPQYPHSRPWAQWRTPRGIASTCQPSFTHPSWTLRSRVEGSLYSWLTPRRSHTASRLAPYSSDVNAGTPCDAHSARTSSGVGTEVA